MRIMAPDFYFSFEAAFYISVFVCCLFIGELIAYGILRKEWVPTVSYTYYTSDDYKKRLKKYTILISLMSLIGSIIYLKAFIDFFGSFAQFLIAGSLIRESLYAGSISIPVISLILGLLSYTAINLSMTYYTKFGFNWIQIIPFLSVVIMSFSQAARAGLVILIFQLFAGKIFRLFTKKSKNIELKLFKPILIIVPILITVFVLVESFRQQNFEVNNSKIEDTSASFSVYAFGGVAGFAAYLNTIRPYSENLTYGRYTFSSLYDILGIARSEPGVYNQYLKVSPSLTGNIYSIFRPLMEDFGVVGLMIWALLLGLVSNYFFTNSLKGSLISISYCITLYTYMMFSFIAPLTQFNSFILSCFLSPLIIFIAKIKFSPIVPKIIK
ncbi:hypothetical protein GCM10028826_01300 [Mucilaginibacter boryungensis]